MRKLRVALVMPNHFDLHSSLGNFLKTYDCLIGSRNVEVTLFTDAKNDISYGDFRIEKLRGVDYGTPLEKLLLLLGIPRFYYIGLGRKLRGFDVITANNPEFYAYAFQAYRAAKKYGTRLVLRTSQTVEGFFLYRATKYIVNPIVKKAYGYSKFLVFTNPEAEERCIKLGLVDRRERAVKSITTGHATDTKAFRPMKLKKPNNPVILSVGGLYRIKGHHLIIQALRKVIDSGHKDAELWIVGKGYYKKELEKLALSLGIKSNVKFLGSKGHGELAGIYNQSDVFVLANYQEVTPAVNEALACGKPVVVMECGGYKFVVPSKEHGLVSKRMDVEDMAAKIIALLNDRKLAARIAKKGRSHIINNFSIEKVAEKLYRSFTA